MILTMNVFNNLYGATRPSKELNDVFKLVAPLPVFWISILKRGWPQIQHKVLSNSTVLRLDFEL
jgi:hypothetical protein